MSLIVAYAYVYHLEVRIIGSLSRTRSGAPCRLKGIEGVTVTINVTVTDALRVSFRNIFFLSPNSATTTFQFPCDGA